MRCPTCQTEYAAPAARCPSCGAHGLPAITPGVVLQQRYRIERQLGRGGMGAVYLAADLRLPKTQWAIKQLSLTALSPAEARQASAAFRQEAELLTTLSHPSLPKVVDYFQLEQHEYLVMEFIPGETLEDLLQRDPAPWLPRRAVGLIMQVADVLQYLHTRQPAIIFRDLKPSNIICAPEGTIRLIDFGIARLFKPEQSRDTQAFGTVGYAAPEQYGAGQTDARADVYALGVLLHMLLTGHDPTLQPFNLPDVQQLNPAVSEELAGAVHLAAAHAVAERFQSVASFRQALQLALEPAAYISGGAAHTSLRPTPRAASASIGGQRPTTSLARSCQIAGLASLGLAVAGMAEAIISPDTDIAIVLIMTGAALSLFGVCLALLALMSPTTFQTRTGHHHAVLGLSCSGIAAALSCVTVGIVASLH